MRLAILSGLAESSLAFIPLCDRIPSASGRAQLLSQAAAIVGVRRRAERAVRSVGNDRIPRGSRSGEVRAWPVRRRPDHAGRPGRGPGAVRPAAHALSSPCRRRI